METSRAAQLLLLLLDRKKEKEAALIDQLVESLKGLGEFQDLVAQQAVTMDAIDDGRRKLLSTQDQLPEKVKEVIEGRWIESHVV